MSAGKKVYCLDANVLIEAWQKYYSPKFCPQYWEILNRLGEAGRIFLPEAVFEEITRTEDDLCEWLKTSKIPVRKIDSDVIRCWQDIQAKNPSHQNLVDNIKGRSLADPWIIAHAMSEKAVVVTKEIKLTAVNSNKIRIPNVCDNMGIAWINDYELITELGILFSCQLGW